MSITFRHFLLLLSPLMYVVSAPVASAQTSAFGGQSAFGSQSAFGTAAGGAATGGAATGGGVAGIGTTQTTFGTLALDPSFGASAIGGNTANAALGGALGRTGLGGIGGLGGLGGLGGGFGGGFGGGLGGLGGRGAQNMNNQNETRVRATVKIGFDYNSPAPAVRSQAINSRLARIPLPAKYNTVQVAMQGRKAVITGTVPTTADGKVIERLLSLEPGVDGVDNQLVFTAESSRSTSANGATSNSAQPVPPSINRPLQRPATPELVPSPSQN